MTWWVGLRDKEKDTYRTHGRNFDEDERYFRCGFEAAQHSANRGKSYEECRARLGDRYPGDNEREPFQRGRAYFEALSARDHLKALSGVHTPGVRKSHLS